jgi:uncharacterized membrane protein
MKKAWIITITVVLLFISFIGYRISQISTSSNMDLLVSQVYPAQGDRHAVEAALGLDRPAFTRIFEFGAAPSPQTYAVYDNRSSGSSVVTNSSINNVSNSAVTAGTVFQQMIVRTAIVAMSVDDINSPVAQITQLTADNNGFVVAAQKNSADNNITGTVSLRIPSEKFESVMADLRSLAVKVTSENVSASDVSQEYIDLSAKLKNSEAVAAQLADIMKKTNSVSEVLAVQTQLTATQQDIEIAKGRIQYLQETAAMSLITINLQQSSLNIQLLSGIGYANTKDNINFKVEIVTGAGPFKYQWDFGDGATSEETGPWHKYTKPGDYTVTVKVTDAKGHNISTETREYITSIASWDAGSIISGAWQGLLVFLKFLFWLFVWVLMFSPVIVAIVIIWRYLRRKNKKIMIKS